MKCVQQYRIKDGTRQWKNKIKWKYLPTYPICFYNVTLNRHIILFGLRQRNYKKTEASAYSYCRNYRITTPYKHKNRRAMVFNGTFNNISVISWRLILLVEDTGIPRENRRPVASYWQTLSHNVVSSTPRHERDSKSQI
jgi:hypothetical protein